MTNYDIYVDRRTSEPGEVEKVEPENGTVTVDGTAFAAKQRNLFLPADLVCETTINEPPHCR